MDNNHPKYVFIYNTPNFPNPFLVHISRKTKTDLSLVRRYEPNIIFCPTEMNTILNSIFYDKDLFQIRPIVKNGLFLLLKENSSITYREIDLCNVAISLIIKNELFEKENQTQTRSYLTERNNIVKRCKTIRERRLIEEAHIGYSFLLDVIRSLQELKYVIQNKKK